MFFLLDSCTVRCGDLGTVSGESDDAARAVKNEVTNAEALADKDGDKFIADCVVSLADVETSGLGASLVKGELPDGSAGVMGESCWSNWGYSVS